MHLSIKRGLTRASALLASALIVCVVGTGSAAAATQHWASGHAAPFGKTQAFTGKSVGNISLTWKYGGGGTVEIECTGTPASGSIENPSSGAVGKLTSPGLQFTGCTVVGLPKCTLEKDEIKFQPLTASVFSEAGKNYIELKPSSGTSLAYVQILGSGCAFGGNYTLTGSLSIYSTPESKTGEFSLTSTVLGTHMKLGEWVLASKGAIALSNSSGETLSLGAEASPHWYIGSTEWKNLANEKPQPVSSGESLSFNFTGKMFGAKVEFACSGSGDKLEGLAENESPGGAAKSSATLSLGHCVLVGEELGPRCSAEVVTFPLSGVAMATPAMMLSPTSGKQLMTVNVKQTAGAKPCSIVGSGFKVTGKLIATSLGEGRFAISGSKTETEFEFEGEKATASGSMALENTAGEAFRLQE